MFDHNAIVPLDPVAFSLGSLSVYWYGICLMTGTLVAYFWTMRYIKRLGISENKFVWMLIFGVIVGVIGARIWYVVFEWQSFKGDLGMIFDLRTGGLAIHGVIVSVAIYMIILAKIWKVPLIGLLEVLAPGLLIGQIIGRWGNFFNQEAHGGLVPGDSLDAQRAWLTGLGIPTFIVNQMYIATPTDVAPVVGYYHPTFLYEMLMNLTGFTLIVLLRRVWKHYWMGDGFLFYLMWYGIVRFIIEIMRTDPLMIGSLKMAQVSSVIAFTVALTLFIVRRIKKYKPEPFGEFMEGEVL